MEVQLTMSFMQKFFGDMLVLYSSMAILHASCVSFKLFEVHITCSYSYYILSVRIIVA